MEGTSSSSPSLRPPPERDDHPELVSQNVYRRIERLERARPARWPFYVALLGSFVITFSLGLGALCASVMMESNTKDMLDNFGTNPAASGFVTQANYAKLRTQVAELEDWMYSARKSLIHLHEGTTTLFVLFGICGVLLVCAVMWDSYDCHRKNYSLDKRTVAHVIDTLKSTLKQCIEFDGHSPTTNLSDEEKKKKATEHAPHAYAVGLTNYMFVEDVLDDIEASAKKNKSSTDNQVYLKPADVRLLKRLLNNYGRTGSMFTITPAASQLLASPLPLPASTGAPSSESTPAAAAAAAAAAASSAEPSAKKYVCNCTYRCHDLGLELLVDNFNREVARETRRLYGDQQILVQ